MRRLTVDFRRCSAHALAVSAWRTLMFIMDSPELATATGLVYAEATTLVVDGSIWLARSISRHVRSWAPELRGDDLTLPLRSMGMLNINLSRWRSG